MKLPWIRTGSASVAELRQQLDAAHTAENAATRATEAAQRAFDADGSAPSEKALLAARDAERGAAEHVARAERLLAAGEQAEAAELRKVNERRKAEIETQLADRSEIKRLEREHARALLLTTDKWQARRDHEEARDKLNRELDTIRVALGAEPNDVYRHIGFRSLEPSPIPIAEALSEEARKMEDEPRRSHVNALAEAFRTGMR